MVDLWPGGPPRLPEAPPGERSPLAPEPPGAWPTLQVDPPRTMSPARAATLGGVAGAIVVALIAGIIGLFVERDDGADAATTGTTADVERNADGSPDIHAILEDVQQSVVAVETATETSQGVFQGAGSGIVLSESGLILTNAHVVSSSNNLTVVLHDGSRHGASLIGAVPEDDLAIIAIDDEVEGLVPATLGSSDDIEVGDPVVAIGNALNLGGPPSVTLGIVSAKDRSIEAPGISLQGLIQTDAAINPGNSGGPLVNANSEVVGINTAIVEDSQNIGFAIAVDLALPIIDQIRAGNATITPDTAFMGLNAQDLDDVPQSTRDAFEVEALQGALVSDVVPGQGADDAGIQVGDVITAIDGRSIAGGADVGAVVRGHDPGDRVEVTIERRGEERTITVTLGRRG